jgi:hypothetical protein
MLRFEDNKEADAFVAAIKTSTAFYGYEVNDGGLSDPNDTIRYAGTEAEAIAMWADPTKLCECHPPWKLPNPIAKGEPGLQCSPVRSLNYGWLVCPQCKKPHPHQFQHPRNLLNPEETPSNRTYCLGFRADRTDQSPYPKEK